MSNVTELRKIIQNLDKYNKKNVEFMQQSTIGKYITIKNTAYTIVFFMIVSALLINEFLMPIQDTGKILYLLVTFDIEGIKQDYGLAKASFSITLFYIIYEAIISSIHLSKIKRLDIKKLSFEEKSECIEAHFHYDERKNVMNKDFQKILRSINEFNKNNNINEVKKLLFKNELQILEKLISSKTDKDF